MNELDRFADYPCQRQCELCGNAFMGGDWHIFCAVCIQKTADQLIGDGVRSIPPPSPQENADG